MSPFLKKLHSLKPHLAEAAQREYDQWDASDPEFGDPDNGFGGICHDIADKMGDVLNEHGIDVHIADSSGGEQHVWPIAYNDHEAYHVDIAPHHYETGGGYNWQKIPGVKFNSNHISIDPAEREGLDDEGSMNYSRQRPVITLTPEQPRRYAAPSLPDAGQPPGDPRPTHPSRFVVRAAKRRADGKFDLYHLVPHKVTTTYRSGKKDHNWVWVHHVAPRTVDAGKMTELIKSGGVAKRGPAMHSPVHPDIVAQLEGKRSVPRPVKSVRPAGRERVAPSERFSRSR